MAIIPKTTLSSQISWISSQAEPYDYIRNQNIQQDEEDDKSQSYYLNQVN